eukprot:3075309-Rhodomonas_salina.2
MLCSYAKPLRGSDPNRCGIAGLALVPRAQRGGLRGSRPGPLLRSPDLGRSVPVEPGPGPTGTGEGRTWAT